MFKQAPNLSRGLLTLLLVVWLSSQAVVAHPCQGQPQTASTLQLGQAIEREIAAGETHSYEIGVEADKFVRVVSANVGLRGGLKLLDPAGQLLSTEDDIVPVGQLKVQTIIVRTGIYRVEFRAFRNQAAGRYKLTWLEARTPTDRERLKQAIETRTLAAQRFFRNGQYGEALEELEHELMLQRQLSSEEPAALAELLSRLGETAEKLGNFAQAESALQEALQLIEQRLGERHTLLPQLLQSLAQLYLTYGVNLGTAATSLQRALTLQETKYGADHVYLSNTLHSLGTLAFTQHDYAQAEKLYQRELALLEKHIADQQQLAQPLAALGRIAHVRGQFEQAEAYWQRALTLREKGLGQNHPTAVFAIFMLGKLAQDRGQLVEAATHYQRAYEILARTRGTEHLDTIAVLEALAQLKLLQNDVSTALSYQTQALTAAQRSLRALLSIGSEQQRRSFLDLYHHQTDALLTWHLRLAPADKTVRDLAVTTLLQRKGLVQETFANTLANLRRRLDPAGQQTLEQWQAVSAQLARLVLDGPAPRTNAEAHQQQLAALTQQRDRLETELSRRSAGSFQPARAVTLAEIQRALPPNAALLEFAVYRPFDSKAPTFGEQYGAPRYAVYIIRPQGAVTWCELGESAPLDTAIKAWRAALRDPKRTDTSQRGRAMSALLWQPLQPFLAGVEHLLISPDGALNLIPFEALSVSSSPGLARRYLIERYTLSYLTSGRDLLRLQASGPAAVSAPLVVADPQFGEPNVFAGLERNATPAARLQRRRNVTTGNELKEVYFAPLFATAQEARTIKTLFQSATVLTGAQATEAALKQANAPQLLHIATHGFFLADTANQPTAKLNPLLRSGLALAQANLRQQNIASEDGILTALEAAGLNLWGTRLVTLSACDTGLGEVRNGEGVYGLRRAFALAGAETLVMSLWPVSDLVTRELMTAYYTNLQRGQGRGAALRAAQLQLLKRPDRRVPYYWASFIQAGEWGALNGQR
jgi:CHAT domain-containing protein